MIQLENMENSVIMHHKELTEQLDIKYKHHIDALLQQKAFIHEQLQNNLYQQLVQINKMKSEMNMKQKGINTKSINNKLQVSQPNEPISTDIKAFCPAVKQGRHPLPQFFPNSMAHNTSNASLINVSQHSLSSRDIDMDEGETSATKATNQTSTKSFQIPPHSWHESNKQMAELFKIEGNRLLKQNQYKEAVDEYTKAIEIDPFNAVYFSNRALAQLKLKNYKESIIDAQVASAIDPHYIKAYIREGSAYYKTMHYQKALNIYSKALEIMESSTSSENCNSFVTELNNNIALCREQLQLTCAPTDADDPPLLLISDQDETSDVIKDVSSSDESSEHELICNLCFRDFRTKEILERHLKNHNVNFRIYDKLQENGNADDKFKKYKLKKEDGFYKCKYCPQTCTASYAMKYHLSVHERKVKHKYRCKYCTYSAMSKQVINKHKALHSDTYDISEDEDCYYLTCTKCEKTFERNMDLEIHLETHKVEKQFGCIQCGKKFANKRGLSVHTTKMHTKKRDAAGHFI